MKKYITPATLETTFVLHDAVNEGIPISSKTTENPLSRRKKFESWDDDAEELSAFDSGNWDGSAEEEE